MPKKYNNAEETSYMKPRYIDANILIDLATHEGAYGYVDVHDIHNTPTADVVERKRGKWIRHDAREGFLIPKYTCSVCYYYSGTRITNFCPNCGAEMEKTDMI